MADDETIETPLCGVCEKPIERDIERGGWRHMSEFEPSEYHKIDVSGLPNCGHGYAKCEDHD